MPFVETAGHLGRNVPGSDFCFSGLGFGFDAGQGIGWLLVFWGISQALSGAVVNGLWTTFMGWFLSGMAQKELTGS